MSTASERETFLKEAIAKRLQRIDSRKDFYRKRSKQIFISTAVLSAIMTILLGLNVEGLKEFVRITALIITTVITVLNAFNGFFNYNDMWLVFNNAHNRFKQLEFEIEVSGKGNATLTEDQLKSFESTYQQILDEMNKGWQKGRDGGKKDK